MSKTRIERINNESGRTVKMYLSDPESTIEYSFSLRPILRNQKDIINNDWPLAELDFTASGSADAPWEQGHIFYSLNIEDIEKLIKLLSEAKEIIKKHEEAI